MAEVAFWAGACAVIYGGIDVKRKGFKISESKQITGKAADALAFGLMALGFAIGIGASICLRTP